MSQVLDFDKDLVQLSEEDLDMICICAEIGSVAPEIDDDTLTRLCESHRAVVLEVITKNVRQDIS